MGFLSKALDRSVLFSFDRSGYLRHRRDFDDQDLEVDLSGKVMLVTGASSGLGLATAHELARRRATVYLLCRDRGRGEAARHQIREQSGSSTVHLALLDVSSLAQVRSFAESFAETRIDVLVNNAGVLPDRRIETEEGLELTWATNVVGPFLLTELLRTRLEAARGARVITVTSGGMYLQKLSLEDLDWKKRAFDGVTAYAESKRAEMVLTELWAERLAATRVSVNAMHPGWADTASVRSALPHFHRLMKNRLRTPEEGADTIVWLAASPSAEGASGNLYFDRARAEPHLLERTRESAGDREALWARCAYDSARQLISHRGSRADRR
jgi:dehydrogenase/reductase SDR family member 12